MIRQSRRFRCLELHRQGMTHNQIAQVIIKEYELAKFAQSQVSSDIAAAKRDENEVIFSRSPYSIQLILKQLHATYAPTV